MPFIWSLLAKLWNSVQADGTWSYQFIAQCQVQYMCHSVAKDECLQFKTKHSNHKVWREILETISLVLCKSGSHSLGFPSGYFAQLHSTEPDTTWHTCMKHPGVFTASAAERPYYIVCPAFTTCQKNVLFSLNQSSTLGVGVGWGVGGGGWGCTV